MKIVQTNTLEDLNKLTRPEFHKLWFNDALTDGQIARKFGTTKQEVKRRRKELKIGWLNSAVSYLTGGPKYRQSSKKKK